MIRLYPEQLPAHIKHDMRSCYLLSGNDVLLQQESKECLTYKAIEQGYQEQLSITVDSHIDWSAVFNFCQELSLFSTKKIIFLDFADNVPNSSQAESLVQLSSLLHCDILLLLKIGRLTLQHENSCWFKSLKATCNAAMIICQTPDQEQLPRWLSARAKAMALNLEEAALQLLCFYYEGNLLALTQLLSLLSLLYPDGQLTYPRVEKAVNDAARFTVYHLVDSLLSGKSKRSWHIFQQLRNEGMEVLILLRVLQKELIQLLEIKLASYKTSLKSLFDQKKIWQTRRPLITQALQRLSIQKITQIISLLAYIEVKIKQDYGQSAWSEFEDLIMIMCNKPLPYAIDPNMGVIDV